MGHPAVTHGTRCALCYRWMAHLALIVVYIRVLLRATSARRQTWHVLLRCQTWQRVAAMPDVAHGVAALPRLPRHRLALLCIHNTYRMVYYLLTVFSN